MKLGATSAENFNSMTKLILEFLIDNACTLNAHLNSMEDFDDDAQTAMKFFMARKDLNTTDGTDVRGNTMNFITTLDTVSTNQPWKNGWNQVKKRILS